MAVKKSSNGFNDEFISRSMDPTENTRFWTCECGFVNDPPAHYKRKNLKCAKCNEMIG